MKRLDVLFAIACIVGWLLVALTFPVTPCRAPVPEVTDCGCGNPAPPRPDCPCGGTDKCRCEVAGLWFPDVDSSVNYRFGEKGKTEAFVGIGGGLIVPGYYVHVYGEPMDILPRRRLVSVPRIPG